MREGSRILDRAEESHQEPETQEALSVDWKEAIYLATRGGALALGLPQESGAFQVGAPFDAQCS
jgi:guanine deaminase